MKDGLIVSLFPCVMPPIMFELIDGFHKAVHECHSTSGHTPFKIFNFLPQ